MLGVRVECPLWVTYLLFILNWISNRVEISCAFPLRCAQNLDGYSRTNNKALLGGKVDVHQREFSEDGGVSYGELPYLE